MRPGSPPGGAAQPLGVFSLANVHSRLDGICNAAGSALEINAPIDAPAFLINTAEHQHPITNTQDSQLPSLFL